MKDDPCPTWEMCSDDHCQKFRKCMTIAWAEYYGVPHHVPALAMSAGTAETVQPAQGDSPPARGEANAQKGGDHD